MRGGDELLSGEKTQNSTEQQEETLGNAFFCHQFFRFTQISADLFILMHSFIRSGVFSVSPPR